MPALTSFLAMKVRLVNATTRYGTDLPDIFIEKNSRMSLLDQAAQYSPSLESLSVGFLLVSKIFSTVAECMNEGQSSLFLESGFFLWLPFLAYHMFLSYIYSEQWLLDVS